MNYLVEMCGSQEDVSDIESFEGEVNLRAHSSAMQPERQPPLSPGDLQIHVNIIVVNHAGLEQSPHPSPTNIS